jgi:L-galactose dehydrogenase
MDYRVLGETGLELSVLGFGAAPFGGAYGSVNEREAREAINTAIELGINFIDGALYCGITQAESVLGRALQTIPETYITYALK